MGEGDISREPADLQPSYEPHRTIPTAAEKVDPSAGRGGRLPQVNLILNHQKERGLARVRIWTQWVDLDGRLRSQLTGSLLLGALEWVAFCDQMASGKGSLIGRVTSTGDSKGLEEWASTCLKAVYNVERSSDSPTENG